MKSFINPIQMKTFSLQITLLKSDESYFIGTEHVNTEIDTDTAKSLIREYEMKVISNDNLQKTWESEFIKAPKK